MDGVGWTDGRGGMDRVGWMGQDGWGRMGWMGWTGGMEWTGLDGVDGVDGMGWDGMGWDGMGWDGLDCRLLDCWIDCWIACSRCWPVILTGAWLLGPSDVYVFSGCRSDQGTSAMGPLFGPEVSFATTRVVILTVISGVVNSAIAGVSLYQFDSDSGEGMRQCKLVLIPLRKVSAMFAA